MIEPLTFRGPQVCGFAGITYRQLDYWCRTGLLRPEQPARGSGSQRGFSLREARIAWTLGQLSSLGPGFLVELDCLRDLDRWGGWLVVDHDGCTHVSGTADLPGDRVVLTLLNLDACPIGVALREEVHA